MRSSNELIGLERYIEQESTLELKRRIGKPKFGWERILEELID